MNSRDYVGIAVIVIGLASAMWQVERLMHNPPSRSSLASVFSSSPVSCTQRAIICSTQNLVCKTRAITLEVANTAIKRVDQALRSSAAGRSTRSHSIHSI